VMKRRAPTESAQGPAAEVANQRSPWTDAVFLAGGHFISAGTLTVANKWALGVFPHVATLTLMQFTVTFVVAWCIGFSGLAEVDALDFRKIQKVTPATLIFFATTFAGQNILSHGGVELFVVVRCMAPLLTFFGEAAFLNGAKPSVQSVLPLLMMICGAMIYIADKAASISSNTMLVVWCGAFLVMMPVDALVIKKIVTDVTFTPWGLVFYNNIVSAAISVPVMLFRGEDPSRPLLMMGDAATYVPVCVTCCLAVSISFFSLNVRKAVTASAFMVLGVLNKFFTIGLNRFFLQQGSGFVPTCGIAMVIVGGVLWNIAMKGAVLTPANTAAQIPKDETELDPLCELESQIESVGDAIKDLIEVEKKTEKDTEQ